MRCRRQSLIALLACSLAPLLPHIAWCQDPSIEIDYRQKKHESEVNSILRKQEQLTPDDEATLDPYFNTYKLLLIKEPPKSYKEAAAFRKTIKEKLTTGTSVSRNGPAHKHLNDLTLAMMQKFVEGEFSSYIKVNAMLLIGELNLEEEDKSNKSFAKPLPEALKFMLDQVKDSQTSDAVKTAALVGIQRHALYSPSASLRPQITNAMLPIVNEKEPPEGRSAEGHAWMRRSAAQVLATLGDIGAKQKNNVLTALAGIVKDVDAPLSLRCAVAQNLGELKYAGAKVDFSVLATDISNLANDVGKRELNWAKDKGKDLSQRRLKAHFTALDLAFTGPPKKKDRPGLIAAAASTTHKAAVEAAHARLQKLLQLVDDLDAPGKTVQTMSKFAKEVGYKGTIPTTPKKVEEAGGDSGGDREKNPKNAGEPAADDETSDPAMKNGRGKAEVGKDEPAKEKRPAKQKDADMPADDEPAKKSK